MSSRISVVMYHYLKESEYSKRLGINNLSINVFEKQVKYFRKYYNLITMKELIDAVKTDKNLPKNAMLLTFDDGLNEHYNIAFPILKDFGIQGSFFVPMAVITNSQLLDVHKIQFILAYANDTKQLIKNMYLILDELKSKFKLRENMEYYKEIAIPGRFDTADINFVKLLLQRVLPKKARKIVIDKLFDLYRKDICIPKEFYLSLKKIEYMYNNGMYIGNHGFNHEWLDTLNKNEQELEIDLSLKYLNNINKNMKDWAMAYPFGSYNDSLISILRQRGCIVGFTTLPNIADIKKDDIFVLPRIDIHYFNKEIM